MFIIIDGIDGSGKTTIIEHWLRWFEERGKSVCNLKKFWIENHHHPDIALAKHADIIFSSEPTYVWTGAMIREELIRNGTEYPTMTVASAYALDRFVLYQRLLLPLREQGKILLQDRGVSTSLCYQSLQGNNPLLMEEIAKLEGNSFALQHAPDHLVITDVPVSIALKRLQGRTQKDEAIFERKEFLEQSQKRFLDSAFQKFFIERGTKIHILDCNTDEHMMKKRSVDLLLSLLEKYGFTKK